MNCEECKLAQKRFREESAIAMAERTIRRLWITVLVLIVVLAGVCVGFFLYEAQFETYEDVQDVVTDIGAFQLGSDNYVVGGDMTYVTDRENSDSTDNNDANKN